MAATNVTKPRKSAAIALPVEETTPMGDALVNAGVTVDPVGTNIPAPIVDDALIEAKGLVNALGTHIPAAPVALDKVITPPTNDAGVNLPAATTNSAKLEVPATPVPPTAAQIAARDMIDKMNTLCTTAYNLRPQASVLFIEPDKAALKAMRQEYAAANGLDLTDEDDLIAAAFAVKALVNDKRNAFLSAVGDQSKVDREWLTAQHVEIKDLLDNVAQLIVTAGGKVKSSTGTVKDEGAPRKARTSTKWAEIAPKLIAHAKTLGLDGSEKDVVYFVDRAKDGYKDTFRPVVLHKDGTWTKGLYNPTTHAVSDTGISVPSWKYFDVDGNDLTDATPKDKIPAHSLSKDEMYGISLIKNGQVLELPIRHDLKDENGKRKPGSEKHYALYTVFAASAGI